MLRSGLGQGERREQATQLATRRGGGRALPRAACPGAAAARLLEAHRRLLPCLQYRNNGGACAWTPAELDASLCTHVIYSFSSLTDHTISGGPTVLFFDPAAATALLPEFRALKGPTRNPNIKLLLAIGGW